MIPLKQTRLGETGNCFETCIASLLNLEIEQVPDLLAYEHGPWMEKINEWLASKYKLAYIILYLPKIERDCFFSDKDFYHVMIGNTNRSSDIKHAVVGRRGKMVHDPHPDNIGILDDDMLKIGVLVSQCL